MISEKLMNFINEEPVARATLKDNLHKVGDTVKFLNNSFARVMRGVRRHDNSSGSVLHGYQVDFSYLIDEIQRGPIWSVTKAVAEANALITDMDKEFSQ